MAKKKNGTTGTCRHCGQTMIIHLPEGWKPEDKTQEEFDDLATEQCECEKALNEAERSRQKKQAVTRMIEFYDDILRPLKTNTPEERNEYNIILGQRDTMIRVVEAVADRQIAAAGIQLTPAQMFSVNVTTKGELRIKRTYKGSEEWIF